MNRSPEELRAELEDRLRFEMLLTELSARFVSVTPETMDDEIVNAQRQIVQTLDLDRSTLAQLEGDERFVATHSWQLPGLAPFPGFAVKELPWLSSAISGGETVCYERIEDMPAEAAREKEAARRFGPRSSVIFPFKVAGRVIGAMAFGTLTREREWPDVLVNRMRLFVEMIGNAIARTCAETATRDALAEVRRLRDQLQRENVYLQQEVKAVQGHGRWSGRARHFATCCSRSSR